MHRGIRTRACSVHTLQKALRKLLIPNVGQDGILRPIGNRPGRVNESFLSLETALRAGPPVAHVNVFPSPPKRRVRRSTIRLTPDGTAE